MEEPGEFVVATLSYCHVPCVLLEDKPPLLPTICSVVAMQAPSSLWGWPSPAPSPRICGSLALRVPVLLAAGVLELASEAQVEQLQTPRASGGALQCSPGTTASVSAENVLEMQVLRPRLRPTESETAGVGPAVLQTLETQESLPSTLLKKEAVILAPEERKRIPWAPVTRHHRQRQDVLTSPSCWQYAVLLNRFNYPFDLEEDLHLKGYRTILQRSLPHCPESLKCYLSSTPGRMPSERHQVGNLKKYYLLNAASLLPVLALEPRDGEKVLDLCAAPGGKLIALLQCAYPGYLHCNEYDGLRLRWLRQTLESFIPQPLVNVIKVSELDGREVGDAQPETFDKVLVDAPCSNDRSWLFSSESQKAACRISQRRNLPVLQIELLRSAIKALRPGGFLVYSTCTLSKAENQDVISEVLNTHSNVVPVDIEDMARTCSQDFTFAPTGQECGLLVIPDKGKAWGPMYVAKLKKLCTT
ncbi:PREDICTED: putative methyltransferase NSUN3 [Ceratotherium simum simum]|uniref:Methyltransferase NSUN3 n=1 Tax=Ceratotherium simum simum TaxID=73337 RepID=A0ABM1DF44_CERSS|nr:PREDICTED: putative methyltransferase NSUN3 [Ceratotherium simum simum]